MDIIDLADQHGALCGDERSLLGEERSVKCNDPTRLEVRSRVIQRMSTCAMLPLKFLDVELYIKSNRIVHTR